MKIVGCLSWFDESPDLLYRAVYSHATVCDEVVALDGRYALFRSPRDESSAEEYDAIHDAGRDAGITTLTVAPPGPWDGPKGGEVAKRAELFRLALERTTDSDWLWIFDADVFLDDVSAEWRDLLAASDRLAALVELDDEVTGRRTLHTTAFRALRGLTVADHHWHYHVPGGPTLWDYEGLCVDPLDLGEEVRIVHRPSNRDERRLAVRRRYYRERDRRGVENGLDDERRKELQRIKRARHESLLAGVAAFRQT